MNRSAVETAAEWLKRSEPVAIPTETVYGLAGNALDEKAVAKIFAIKNRPLFDPLIVHGASAEALAPYVNEWPKPALLLAERFWPGPLTLLLPRTSLVPDIVTSGLRSVAVRVPAHPLALELLSRVDFPLAAPSANPFGYVSPTRPEHVAAQLGDKIAFILDGGPCAVGIESTIVGFPNDIPTVFRLGGLSIEVIEDTIGKVDVATNTRRTPGSLGAHYAPTKKLLLGNPEQLLKAHPRAAVLAFTNEYPAPYLRVLSPTGNLTEAAANFFGFLRELDQTPAEIIVAETLPEVGLGRAINDRLRRAQL
ncbi:MAG: L-threonylcarbamoyladenylate synthase [Bacteroidia bacterium]|nr:L-threonylcarbamoyladenylate synthase [Bacteroidia bacterium]MDW8332650.1 L-threonylcarbamoyladenylate synthase [Bacteroidia bacterium]